MDKATNKVGLDVPPKLVYEKPAIEVIELERQPMLLSGSTSQFGGQLNDVEREDW